MSTRFWDVFWGSFPTIRELGRDMRYPGEKKGEVHPLPLGIPVDERRLDFGVVDYLAVPPGMNVALSFYGAAAGLNGGAPHGDEGELCVVGFGRLL